MTLKQIKDWLKKNYDCSIFEQVSIGKIDNNLSKNICFYNSKYGSAYINRYGVSTYSIKPLTILVRYGTNQDEAEIISNKIYKFFDKKKGIIDKKRVFFLHKFENPINLGTDDNGIVEYSIEINCCYEKED